MSKLLNALNRLSGGFYRPRPVAKPPVTPAAAVTAPAKAKASSNNSLSIAFGVTIMFLVAFTLARIWGLTGGMDATMKELLTIRATMQQQQTQIAGLTEKLNKTQSLLDDQHKETQLQLAKMNETLEEKFSQFSDVSDSKIQTTALYFQQVQNMFNDLKTKYEEISKNMARFETKTASQ